MIRKLLASTVVGLALSTGAAAQVQFTTAMGGNDHWYQYVAGPVTWQQAFTAANASSFMGLQGYLATITSVGENFFVAQTVIAQGHTAWLGGSDAGNPTNQWTWRNGPENGQAFTFTYWHPGEPNNVNGGEDYLVTNWGSFGSGAWNDIGAPAQPDYAVGYVVEYSHPITTAVPEPETYAMMLAGLGLLGFAARRRKQKSAA